VHEAGHAVIYEVLAGRAVSLATAFRSQDEKGGICYCYRPVDCAQRVWDEVRLLGGLGGRAATDLVYGMADDGASDDIHRVSGYLKPRIKDSVVFGSLMAAPREESPHYEMRMEALVEAELNRLYQKTKEILAANREFLDKLTDAICENEYLISSDIQAIKESCSVVRVAA
jgi:cell division protease FtsH